ncbi:MAG: rod shape-determining protein MreD [Candidatus Portnoybacteria bacterium]|nr:rod shape-determining protein MreD [Candidatus Portnoybacteria bacterium]
MKNLPAFVFILFLAILQAALSPHFKILGVAPNFVYAFVVVFSVKKSDGPILLEAFLAGLILDLFSSLPMGIFTFLLPLLVWLIKFFGKNIFQTSELFGKIFLLAASSLAFPLFYILLADLLQNFNQMPEIGFWHDFFWIGLLEAAWNFLLSLLFFIMFFGEKKAELRNIKNGLSFRI